MTENPELDAAKKMIVRAFIYESGQSAELKRGTLPEILGQYESSASAFVVARPGKPGEPRTLDFFITAGAKVGERTAQGFAIGIGAAGQLTVTLEDGSPVIVYAPGAWLEYTPG